MDMLRFLLAACLTMCAYGPSDANTLPQGGIKLDPEVDMNTVQLITSKGYPCETHEVHTSDGYILEVQRIPYGRNDSKPRSGRPAVLLQHGLLSSSASWVENLANESLGFILADAGYDVWLGNSRGNTYGRRHEKLDPKQIEFWAFSWDQMAKYDLPATVDKVLNVSGATQIFYGGHSQGASIGYAGFSKDSNLASKIKLFVALAPAVYMDLVEGPFRILGSISRELDFVYALFGKGEFLPNDDVTKSLGKKVCSKPTEICADMIFILCGYDEKNINVTRIPVYFGQNPAGTSVQNINHYAQMVDNPASQMYDYGTEGNMKAYNQTTPPLYNPSQMTVPVAMFSGSHDRLVPPGDITRLVRETSNLVYHKVINGYEHVDFVWAMDAPHQCYNEMIQLFKDREE